MPDRFGPRGVVAVAIPAQNSNMQPEYEAMRPEGISNQMYRFNIAEQHVVPEAVIASLPQTAGCWPDIVVCSNSLEMRWWSVERQIKYRQEIAEAAGDVPIVNATDATVAALKTVGAKRLALLSPMDEVMSKSAADYYEAHGFEVISSSCFYVPTSDRIIDITEESINNAFAEAGATDADTILHVGGALGIVDLIDEFEVKYNKAVVSSNAATYWYALRMLGIEDHMDRGGKLTRMALSDDLRTPVPPVV